MARSSRLSQIDERREEIAREAKRLTAERKLEARKRQRMQQRVGRVPTEDLLAVIADRHVAERRPRRRPKPKPRARAGLRRRSCLRPPLRLQRTTARQRPRVLRMTARAAAIDLHAWPPNMSR